MFIKSKLVKVQKKRDSFTYSFLVLTYWFHFNLISIFKKFRLFPKNCFYCATHNKHIDEISKFLEKKKKKCHKKCMEGVTPLGMPQRTRR